MQQRHPMPLAVPSRSAESPAPVRLSFEARVAKQRDHSATLPPAITNSISRNLRSMASYASQLIPATTERSGTLCLSRFAWTTDRRRPCEPPMQQTQFRELQQVTSTGCTNGWRPPWRYVNVMARPEGSQPKAGGCPTTSANLGGSNRIGISAAKCESEQRLRKTEFGQTQVTSLVTMWLMPSIEPSKTQTRQQDELPE